MHGGEDDRHSEASFASYDAYAEWAWHSDFPCWTPCSRPYRRKPRAARHAACLINYLPNGMIMKAIGRPRAKAPLLDLPNTLEPMAANRDRILVLSGMKRFSRPVQNAGAGAHATCGATYLTGVAVRKNGGSALEVGMSVDQVAANQIGTHTRFPSLELSCEDGRMVGSCDPPYSCVYNNTISWRSATTPSASEINPRALV